MKIIPVFSYVLLQLTRFTVGQVVDFNRALSVSFASDIPADRTVSFLANDEVLPPASLLASLGSNYKEPVHKCFSQEEGPTDEVTGNVTVLIAISKCLENKELKAIKDWVGQITKDKKLYTFGTATREIQFEIATVPGNCTEARRRHGYNNGYNNGHNKYNDNKYNDNDYNDNGYNDNGYNSYNSYNSYDDSGNTLPQRAPALLSNDVQASDIARFSEHFGEFGRVLGAMQEGSMQSPPHSGGMQSPPTQGGMQSPPTQGGMQLPPTQGGMEPQQPPGGGGGRGGGRGDGRGGGNSDVVPPKPDVTGANTPISVISISDNGVSTSEIEYYERKFEISHVINFNICKNGATKCKKSDSKAVHLSEAVDIFMYNPFTVVRQLDCGKGLAGGVPVSYLDAYGKRQCFCTCPVGYSEIDGSYGNKECKKDDPEACPCVWSNPYGGYHVQVTEQSQAQGGAYGDYNTCEITKLASNSHLPVPFPSDNYVSDYRNNIDETAYVMLTAQNTSGDARNVTGSGTFAWMEYQKHYEEKIDALKFGGYGEYKLSLLAKDYYGKAECTGCVAIVDKYRPKASAEHPCPDLDHGRYGRAYVSMTADTLSQAQDYVNEFYDFGANAENDACSTDNRCDYQDFQQKDFFDTVYSSGSYDDGRTFFDGEKTVKAFVVKAKAKGNPLVKAGDPTKADDCEVPVPPGQCQRCAKLSTELKEWWTDFKCDSAYDTQQCEGRGGKDGTCDLEQCLTLEGETIALATVMVNTATQTASQKVLDQLTMKGYQTISQIHRAVRCPTLHEDSSSPTFSGLECSYSVALPSLFTVDAVPLADIGNAATIGEIVFWRYKVEGQSWKLWKDAPYADTEVFTNAKTNVYVEAWTQCGLVKKFVFTVHLHPHSDVDVCQSFANMWYQTSVSRLAIANTICTYPKSDFAELTFDYRANSGLMYARDSLSLHVSDVKCSLQFADHTRADILHETRASTDVVKRFAVEAINNDKTAETTKFTIECAFTYMGFDDHTVVKTCDHAFEIRDCTPPEIDYPPKSECLFKNCGGVDTPGAFEACDGIVVKAKPGWTDNYGHAIDPTTYVTTTEQTCCNRCSDAALTCTPILDLPEGEDTIKRCEPPPSTSYDAYGSNPYSNDAYSSSNPYDNSYTTALMSTGHAIVNAGQEHAAVTALLGVSAMVALVALVVVKRRHSASNNNNMAADDAYYPLLH